ncbi:MAG TPA: YihY/virulence factor BrkB family protein [Oxalicibacterium sp.]|jgi:membrane protein|nr:YihY/virulence factor BrkB family protein [Oxalicibacterium sp.]
MSTNPAVLHHRVAKKRVLIGTTAATLAVGAFFAKKKYDRVHPKHKHEVDAAKNEAVASSVQPSDKRQLIDLLKVTLPLILAFQAERVERVERMERMERMRAEQETPHKEAAPLHEAVSSPQQYVRDAAAGASLVAARIAPGTRWQQGWRMVKASVNAWIDDFAPSMGAAIAYYTIFSIAPMLVIAIAVAGMLFGQEAAQGEIVNQLRGLLGTEGAVAVQGLLKSANEPTGGIIATVLSVITLAIGATAVFAELQSALDRIWRVPAAAKAGGIWNLIRTRLLSFGFVLGLGFLLIVSLVVSAALSALGNWWDGWFEGWEIVLQTLNFVVSIVVFTCMFAFIYKFMPRVSLSWHDVWIGAISTTLLFTAGKFLIGLYLGKSGMSSGFGATGSIVLLLAWVYYSAQIFLLGAEFTWIYANNYGSRATKPAA